MTRPGVDRRVARTRRALGQALVSLVRARGYEAVGVADVCAAADVGRSTFYAHYVGKDDLKRRAMAAHLQEVIAQGAHGAEPSDPLGFSLPLLLHARDHLDLRHAMAGGPGERIALEVLGDVVRRHVRATLAGAAAGQKGDEPPEVVATFVAGAWLALHVWWLDGGARLSPREVDAVFRKLAMRGLGLGVSSDHQGCMTHAP